QPILIGEATYPGGVDDPHDKAGLKVIKVTIPQKSNRGALIGSYRLRVKADDEKKNSFAAETHHVIQVNIPECVTKMFAEAVSAQKRGDMEQAVILYNRIDELHRDAADSTSMAKQMETNFFNRGLAYLSMALALKPGDLKRRGYLAKALTDFEQVVRFHSADEDAFLLKGLVGELRDEYRDAFQSYGSAISLEPRAARAYALRGRAYVRTHLKKNLARAVDDFTKAITLNPQNNNLRKIRRATLKLDLEHDGEPDDASVDTSSVPIGKIGQGLDLEKFHRTLPAQ
ncbi:MAG: tetratricopeptide repeat protein, partial [Deltaproteobacteria bacterium]